MTENGKAKRSAAAQGRRNRQRGQEGEREVCALLSTAFGREVRRVLGQERDRGTDVMALPPFRIEVKRRKAVAGLYDWIQQATGLTKNPMRQDGRWYSIEKGAWYFREAIPVVLLRADNQPWLAVMRMDDWAKLAKKETGG
jgi:hypothetical protein